MSGIQITTFGHTSFSREGQPLTWTAVSARDLLQYLLSFPDGRTRAQIIDGLWNQDDTAQTNNHFRVTLHRLRGTLGAHDTVEEDSGRYHLSPDVWRHTDIYAFHRSLIEAERTGLEGSIPALHRAVLYYQGPFLTDVAAEWVACSRSEHQAAFTQAQMDLGAAQCVRGACQEAVTCLTQALRLDPYLDEAVHERFMACLSVVQGTSAALEHYRRYMNLLQREFSALPALPTWQLAQRLQSGASVCPRVEGQAPLYRAADQSPLAPSSHCHGNLRRLITEDLMRQSISPTSSLSFVERTAAGVKVVWNGTPRLLSFPLAATRLRSGSGPVEEVELWSSLGDDLVIQLSRVWNGPGAWQIQRWC